MAAGKGGDAGHVVFRAWTGTRKVEIGGRRYAFSCTPLFRLEDERSGRVHECAGNAALLQTAIALAQEDADD
jgi:hypothetical protein